MDVFGSEAREFLAGDTEDTDRLVWIIAVCEDWARDNIQNAPAARAIANALPTEEVIILWSWFVGIHVPKRSFSSAFRGYHLSKR